MCLIVRQAAVSVTRVFEGFSLGRHVPVSPRETERAVPGPDNGQVALRVERFTLSANNATYARLGASAGCWQFYPAEPGWGVVPVWGIARAEQSMSAVVATGTRISGFLPMASHVVLQPGRADSGGFTEDSPRRRDLPRLYNVYRRVPDDAAGWSAADDRALALRPSFWLSFLLADFLSERDYFGADLAVVSSASSKSALGTARLLGSQLPVVGLTSAARRDAVTDTGVYAQVATYDDVAALPVGPRCSWTSPAVRSSPKRCTGTTGLSYAIARWQVSLKGPGANGDAKLPAPEPELFSVPEYIRVRAREVGMPILAARFEDALTEFGAWCEAWLEVKYSVGAAGVADAYRSVLNGSGDATTATIGTL